MVGGAVDGAAVVGGAVTGADVGGAAVVTGGLVGAGTVVDPPPPPPPPPPAGVVGGRPADGRGRRLHGRRRVRAGGRAAAGRVGCRTVGTAASSGGVVGELRLQTFTLAEGGRPERLGDHVDQHVAALVGRMQPIAAQHARILRHLLPVEQGHVVELLGELADALVRLGIARLVLRDGEQQRRARRETGQDQSEFGLEALLIGPVVGPEVHDGCIPVVVGTAIGVEAPVEHEVAEVDEPAGLGLHCDRPAERDEFVAHVPGVPRRGRCHDRIADHEDAVPGDLLAHEFGHGSVLVDRPVHDHERLPARFDHGREHPDTADRGQRCEHQLLDRRFVAVVPITARREQQGCRHPDDGAARRDADRRRPITHPLKRLWTVVSRRVPIDVPDQRAVQPPSTMML